MADHISNGTKAMLLHRQTELHKVDFIDHIRKAVKVIIHWPAEARVCSHYMKQQNLQLWQWGIDTATTKNIHVFAMYSLSSSLQVITMISLTASLELEGLPHCANSRALISLKWIHLSQKSIIISTHHSSALSSTCYALRLRK